MESDGLGHILSKPLTLGSALLVALGYAGEYALLSLIEDSPLILKVATMFCAGGAVVALETKDRLEKIRPRLFIWAISAAAIIYLGFVAYAVGHAISEAAITKKLEQLYADGSDLKQRPFHGVKTPEELSQWVKQVDDWSNETAAYLRDNISGFAHDRFLNTTRYVTLSHMGLSDTQNAYVSQIDLLQQNLEPIIAERESKK